MVEIIDENFFKRTSPAPKKRQDHPPVAPTAKPTASKAATAPKAPTQPSSTNIASVAQAKKLAASLKQRQPVKNTITSAEQAQELANQLRATKPKPTPAAKTITMIAAQKRHKGRYNVYLNGEFAFGVSEMVLVKYRLHKGMTLTPKQLKELTTAETFAQAYAAALNYLSYSLRSEREIQTKLKELAVPAEQITAICAKLKEQRLLDDAAYALSFVRTQRTTQGKGPAVIARKLKQKGIANELITAALDDEFDQTTQLERAKDQAPKLWRRYRTKPARMQKTAVINALINHGYSSDCATAAATATQPVADASSEANKLSATATKLVRRYQSKANGKNKFIAAMMRRGFEYSAIQQFLADENIEWQ